MGWHRSSPYNPRPPASESLVGDLDAFDDDVLARSVLGAGRGLADGLDDLVALGDLAEDRVLAGQPRRGGDGDEELRAVRAGARVRHGQQARLVEPGSAGRDLVLERVAGSARAGAGGVAALDHEAVDHAVEDRAGVQGLDLGLPVARV